MPGLQLLAFLSYHGETNRKGGITPHPLPSSTRLTVDQKKIKDFKWEDKSSLKKNRYF